MIHVEPPVLSLEGVHKTFGRARAVAGVSLAVRAGEIVALLGPNGAGKTTLLRMAIGMLRPDRGEVRYRLAGRTTTEPVPEHIGYLPEERGLYPDVPVRRTLLYFAALRGMPRAEARREADRWLDRLGLLGRAGEELRNLSKGNQQKVQFISVILHRPALAVLDEPFSGLDPLNQDFFVELIRQLRAQGTAVLLSAHHMQLVERLADRVVLLREGEVVGQGSIDELRLRWGATRRLRLRVEGRADPGVLDGLPGVLAAARCGRDEIEIVLGGGAPLGHLLQVIGQRLVVRDLWTESITLHDLYVRLVSEVGVPEVVG